MRGRCESCRRPSRSDVVKGLSAYAVSDAIHGSSRSDVLKVAVGLQPTESDDGNRNRRAATAERHELNECQPAALEASLRDAASIPRACPWAEAHGYPRAVAPRCSRFHPKALYYTRGRVRALQQP